MKLSGKVNGIHLETRSIGGKSIETLEIVCDITPGAPCPTHGVGGAICFPVLPEDGASWLPGTPVTVTVQKGEPDERDA